MKNVEKLMSMNGNYLLDTNIIIDLFRGNETTVNHIKRISTVYVPTIILGELYYGAYKSNQTNLRILEIQKFEENVIILNCSGKTAKVYGEIKNQLYTQGTPIPENDIWIASIAKENNLPLITKDKHFEQVIGINLEKI